MCFIMYIKQNQNIKREKKKGRFNKKGKKRMSEMSCQQKCLINSCQINSKVKTTAIQHAPLWGITTLFLVLNIFHLKFFFSF